MASNSQVSGKMLLNVILCILTLALLILLPIRNLLAGDTDSGARAEGGMFATYVMLFLFGSLTIVFGCRAIKGLKREQKE